MPAKFDQATLDRAGREFAKVVESRPAFKPSPSGEIRVIRQIPLAMYLNACAGHGEGGEEYWRDMERRFPEIKVDNSSGRISVRVGDAGRGRPLTRFGRVTFRKVYK